MNNAPKTPETLVFPVSLDLFLRYTAGGKYKADRLKKYRAFLADAMRGHRYMIEGRLQGKKLAEMPKPSLVQVGEVIGKHRAEGFDRMQFTFAAAAFREWLAGQPSVRARRAAKARWSQARRHKANAPKIKALLDVAAGQ